MAKSHSSRAVDLYAQYLRESTAAGGRPLQYLAPLVREVVQNLGWPVGRQINSWRYARLGAELRRVSRAAEARLGVNAVVEFPFAGNDDAGLRAHFNDILTHPRAEW